MVEGDHFICCGLASVDDLEMRLKTECFHKRVSHFDSARFHEVIFAELEVGDFLVEEVHYFVAAHFT